MLRYHIAFDCFEMCVDMRKNSVPWRFSVLFIDNFYVAKSAHFKQAEGPWKLPFPGSLTLTLHIGPNSPVIGLNRIF